MLRKYLKKQFDRVAYSSPALNWILRNLNKAVSPLTGFRLRPYGKIGVSFGGRIRFRLATNETNSVTKALFWKGAVNYEYSSVFFKLLPSCNVFLDVGANIGYYSVLAAKANKSLKVFAFEPASAVYKFLERNIHINKLEKQITPLSSALSNIDGEIQFAELVNPDGYHTEDNLAGTGSIVHENSQSANTTVRIVKCETLDGFISRNSIDQVDLIKMDTEGSEHLVLEGARETLQNKRPIIICEVLFNQIEEKIEKSIMPFDYRIYKYKDRSLIQTDTLVRSSDDGVRDCFLVPNEKVGLLYESGVLVR